MKAGSFVLYETMQHHLHSWAWLDPASWRQSFNNPNRLIVWGRCYPLYVGDQNTSPFKQFFNRLQFHCSVGKHVGSCSDLIVGIRNYLAPLSWSHGDDEIFSTEQVRLRRWNPTEQFGKSHFFPWNKSDFSYFFNGMGR